MSRCGGKLVLMKKFQVPFDAGSSMKSSLKNVPGSNRFQLLDNVWDELKAQMISTNTFISDQKNNIYAWHKPAQVLSSLLPCLCGIKIWPNK